MRKIVVIGAIILFVVGAASPLFSQSHECGCSFTVANPNHSQELGGKSGQKSHDGLHVAEKKSPTVTHTHSQ